MKKVSKVTLELSRDDFRELLLLAALGDWVRGAVMDAEGHGDEESGDARHEIHDRVYDALLEKALEEKLPEAQAHEDHVDPARWFDEEAARLMREYDDDAFWTELERRLGRRDFDREVSEEDRTYMETHAGWLPERVHDFYDKYADEFESFGIDRLEINKNAPVSDIRDAL